MGRKSLKFASWGSAPHPAWAHAPDPSNGCLHNGLTPCPWPEPRRGRGARGEAEAGPWEVRGPERRARCTANPCWPTRLNGQWMGTAWRVFQGEHRQLASRAPVPLHTTRQTGLPSDTTQSQQALIGSRLVGRLARTDASAWQDGRRGHLARRVARRYS